VVGFDGLPRGAVLDPVLTTVVQPVVEVGRRAVGLLASDQPDSLVLPVTLRLGGSCGPH
jgi:DNA-binding LacI/PurR family transcriptional regulator